MCQRKNVVVEENKAEDGKGKGNQTNPIKTHTGREI